MSGRENNAQHQKLKINKPAVVSIFVCFLGIIIIVLRIVFYRPWWSEYVARNTVGMLGIVGLVIGFISLRKISKRLAIITLLVAFCSCLIILSLPVILHCISVDNSAVRIFLQRYSLFLSLAFFSGLLFISAIILWRSKSKGKLKGSVCAILGVVLGVLLADCWFVETFGSMSKGLGMCANNLQQLNKAILLYSNDNNGCYPEPSRWCDLLLEYEQIELRYFLCPGVTSQWRRQVFPWPILRNERCYYAMNPNCEPNSPADTVLLFEAKGGWNRFGGPELMTTGNHFRHSNILFNDGHVESMNPKHINDLNWGRSKGASNE
jgi:prepilin-type processing-associated H-X9-DG protein